MTGPTQALVLAAGPAQRLLPLTANRPKGMLLVGGRPLLQHAVEALKAHGVTDVVVVVGANGEKIQSFLKDGHDFGLRIRYAHQARPDGTLAAVRLALPELDGGKPVLILPGHAYVTRDLLAPLLQSPATSLLVATAAQGHRQGVPSVRARLLAAMGHDTPTVGSTRVGTNLMNAGADFLAAVASGGLDGHTELDLALGDWAARGGVVHIAEAVHPWRVLVEPWDLLRLNEEVLEHLPRGRNGAVGPPPAPPGSAGAPGDAAVHGLDGHGRDGVRIGRDTVVAPTATLIGPVTVGDGCTIGDYAVVGPYVSIRNATVVGSHCEVRRSILNNNVLLDSHSVLRGGILDDGAQVGPGFLCQETATGTGLRGCIIGRDAVLRARTTLPGGSLVEPEARV